MHPRDDTLIPRVLGELLRAPPALRELPLEQALTRLQAARGDAAYLLLHRVLVLEAVLQQVRANAVATAAAAAAVPAALAAGSAGPTPAAAIHPPTASPASAPRPGAPGTPLPRSVLRDAATVALGVVAGQAVWEALDGDHAAAASSDAADLAGDAGSWLEL